MVSVLPTKLQYTLVDDKTPSETMRSGSSFCCQQSSQATCTDAGVDDDIREAQIACLDHAQERFESYTQDSSIPDKTNAFPKFDLKDLKLGKVLGEGCFGIVTEVRGIVAGSGSGSDSDTSSGEQSLTSQMRSESFITEDPSLLMKKLESTNSALLSDESMFLSEHCVRKKTGDSRYAIKVLRQELTDKLVQGALDIAMESRILSYTRHPNIIKARGFSNLSPFDPKVVGNYFILMDRLYDTLKHRIHGVWKKKIRNKKRLATDFIFDRNGIRRKQIWIDQLVAAFDLSDALGYLHEKNIVYRDLKSDNVGFDVRGDVKLFDFGLATELKDSRKTRGNLYNLTVMTGTPRYMAPEVANYADYNEKCDVYSFAILLWEILAMSVPFKRFGMMDFKTKVWNQSHTRPQIDRTWPKPIQEVLALSWSKEAELRPDFPYITKILRDHCVIARDGNSEGLEHSTRRSTYVYRGQGDRESDPNVYESRKSILAPPNDQSTACLTRRESEIQAA